MGNAGLATMYDSEPRQGYAHALGVFQGRGHPFHDSHAEHLRRAFGNCAHAVYMVGSSNKARDFKNPWTWQERAGMVEAIFPEETKAGRFSAVPMPDYFRDNTGWAANVRRLVDVERARIAENFGCGIESVTTALTGFKKDESSFYLDMFPEWADIRTSEAFSPINATEVREAYFAENSVILEKHLPAAVIKFLIGFRKTPMFDRLLAERLEIDHCRAKYPSDAEHPHRTGDLMITHRGKVLLVVRGGKYGYGLHAFPGGIRDQGEDDLECSLREVGEETGLFDLNPSITFDFLRKHVVGSMFNDTPGRDLRGTYHTTLFHVALPEDIDTPRVKGMDDAKLANWHDPDAIDSTEWFADHEGMLRAMLARQR